jgi:N-acetylmuramoyl-L-alanine amidase
MSCRLNALLKIFHTGIALSIIFLMPSPSVDAKSAYWGRSKKIIVLDPGHGGVDEGVRSPDGILEKKVVLELSKRIADQIKGPYRVNLTRSDDYRIDTDRRTDVANNNSADIFISIHAAGSYAQAAKGICIYYFKGATAREKDDSVSQINDQESLPAWDHLQLRHIHTSRLLAEHLRKQLSPLTQTTITAAPLLVLKGADMPAVLIEIGYLSNPEDVKALREFQHLDTLAVAILAGINEFFSDLN